MHTLFPPRDCSQFLGHTFFCDTSIQNCVKKLSGGAEHSLPCGIHDPQLLAPRPGLLVQTAGKQIQSKPHYQLATKFDHLLGALPTEVCTNITDSLRDIDESAPHSYEQLKTLLVSRYTNARWTRAFKLLKFPEVGDMKPTDLMRQMKALLAVAHGLKALHRLHGHVPPPPALRDERPPDGQRFQRLQADGGIR